MASLDQKYLEMTPQEIFEKYPIDKIVEIQKEIQHEIDKKRHELRTMVGERYRDVIEASDTIKSMQESAADVVNGINKIVELCADITALKDYIEPTGQQNQEDKQKKDIKNTKKSISMQIKILIYIPEQIWTAIDEKNFLRATQLYLLAQHIYTGLKLDRANNVLNNYPMVNTQWMKIGHFQKRISSHLHSDLQKNNLTAEVAANYLSAYVLLENISVGDLLQQFISFRKVVLKNEMKSDINSNNTVKSLTCSALKLIINTIQLIYLCFIDSGSGTGLLYEKLNSIVSKSAIPSISIVDIMPDHLFKYLPKIVSEFRPILSHPVDSVTSNTAGEYIQKWLRDIKESINEELLQRLHMVTSIKSLDNIRDEALKIEIVDNWETLCQKLSLPRNFNVWFLIFQPLITDRVCALIETKWAKIVETTESEISQALAKASSGTTAKSELDLRWFIWKEEKSDVPFKFNFNRDNKFDAKGLFMKSKGYSPTVIKLVEDFDSRLTMLLNDLEVYLNDQDIHSERAAVRADIFLKRAHSQKSCFEQFSDKVQIEEHLQNVSKDKLEKLVTNIMIKSNNKNLSPIEKMTYDLMIARLLLALQQLSPGLVKCFKREGRVNQWNERSAFLQEKKLETWKRWLNVMNLRLSKFINETLSQCLESNVPEMLQIFPQWTTFEIEEQTEDTKVKSKILVPSQPNFLLQNLLFKICSKLNTVIPHTLPKQIHLELVDSIVEQILTIYSKIAENENLIQSQSLQFLFDVKYVNLMFVPRENKELSAKVKDICEGLRSKIDPFDYDVFYPHIQNGVMLSAQKTQNILGILVPKPDQLSLVLGSRHTGLATNISSVNSPEKDAMTLALSDTSNVWFALLPVTAPVLSRSKSVTTTTPQVPAKIAVEKKKVTKSSPRHSKHTGNSSNLVRSGPTSFLSDWFG